MQIERQLSFAFFMSLYFVKQFSKEEVCIKHHILVKMTCVVLGIITCKPLYIRQNCIARYMY